jgi:hypothetical protein
MTFLHRLNFATCSRAALIVLLPLAFVGCSNNMPDLGPASWYRGSVTVDPPAATVFGPAGDVAIEWQRIPPQSVWIWRENRGNGWNAQTVWEAGAAGNFKAMISTGAWEGNVAVEDYEDSSIYAPGGWTYSLSLSNNTGTIVGTGETGNDDNGGNDAPQSTTPFIVWIKLKWLRPDGSVGATMSETITACNEEEYLNAVMALGGQPPARSR